MIIARWNLFRFWAPRIGILRSLRMVLGKVAS